MGLTCLVPLHTRTDVPGSPFLFRFVTQHSSVLSTQYSASVIMVDYWTTISAWLVMLWFFALSTVSTFN